MFFGDIDNPIGIDISDVSVKLVQFNRRNGKLEVAAYSDVPLPSGLVENDIVENEEGLVSFLKGIFRNKTYQTGKLNQWMFHIYDINKTRTEHVFYR